MTGKHGHETRTYTGAFAAGVLLNVAFVAAEASFGYLSGSMALIADAGHNLSDVLSLLLAWGAAALARLRPTAQRTYGFRRATILAALLSAIVLIMALGIISWQAVERLIAPTPVPGRTVIVVAAIGAVINAVTALLFMSGRKRDLNIRGAFLHMAADAGVSVGVVIAGVGIIATGWMWLDPAVSLGIVLVILIGTWGLLRDSTNLVMDAVPKGIDAAEVLDCLASRPGVSEVHDLHIWGMSTTEPALTVHLVTPERATDDRFIRETCRELRERFGITHVTIQMEASEALCEQSTGDQV
jgi:cobalt-zinc-cadmium efflux system protein